MSATCFDVTFGADGFWHVLSACMEKDENKDFFKKTTTLKNPSFPGERENPTMSKITTLSERETSSRLHNRLVNSCQHVHSSPGAVFIFRLRNNSPPFFPLKMHSMVLPSNQLIRRPEPRPSWYQLILSRRKKERKLGVELINFQCSSTAIHGRLSANHCHGINSPLISGERERKAPLIGCRSNFAA